MNKFIKFASGLVVVVALSASVGCQKTQSASQPARAASPAAIPQGPLAPNGAQPPLQAAQPPNPEDQMRRIRVEEAMQLAKAGDALIIDVRGTEVFKTQHIKGAIDFPLDRIEKGDLQTLPRNKMIIAYCA